MTSPPPPLNGDPTRQAVAAQAGFLYQALHSIDAWLQMADGDAIYLECAEDFDRVSHEGGIVAQVRNTAAPISLGSAKCVESLEHFWSLTHRESRPVEYHYITTSGVAHERDASFAGLNGIDAWRAAQTNKQLASAISAYLAEKLPPKSPLRAFLMSATPEQVQLRLFRKFRWLTEQPDRAALRRSIDDRIIELLAGLGRSIKVAQHVFKHLESKYWEVLDSSGVEDRRLTKADLLTIIEEVTVVYVPVPIEQIPELLVAFDHGGRTLLRWLVQKSPLPPSPLLSRSLLVARIEALVDQRRAILLTGGVFKGKSTLAQLAVKQLGQESWWVPLSDRTPNQVDSLLLAAAREVEQGSAPSAVVLDDLDVSPGAHRVYRDSLALLLQRATNSGVAVLITAQGATFKSFDQHSFPSLTVIEVEEVSAEEATELCRDHGCPQDLARMWGALLHIVTAGHPKLLQVRLSEIDAAGWPPPAGGDVLSPSTGVLTAKQLARDLLRERTSEPEREFIYTLSEAVAPLDRRTVLRLGECVGLASPGDVVDALNGKWLEQSEISSLRVTALLRGQAREVWTEQRVKQAHSHLHTAILRKKQLDHIEAGALLWHAYMSGDAFRITHAGMSLQILADEPTREAVYGQLLWLPLIALRAGESIASDPVADAAIRGLQCRVASVLDSESLPLSYERWAEAIERVPHQELRDAMQSMLYMTAGIEQSTRLPLTTRLRAVVASKEATGEIAALQKEAVLATFERSQAVGLPSRGTGAQLLLLRVASNVRDASGLNALLDWLENQPTGLRAEFDEMLDWPVTQSLGAFVQGAWVTNHESTTEWLPWIQLFERAWDVANRCGSPNLGREAAKAKAIILTEYLDRGDEALATLDAAERDFGSSPVLLEQRANVRFQLQDDEQVLTLWSQLRAARSEIDPFACRRIAISACRLNRFEEAADIFLSAALSIDEGTLEVTKLGLHIDAATSLGRAGDIRRAVRVLAEATSNLPAAAGEDGNPRWEAVIRAASETRRNLESLVWTTDSPGKELPTGFASDAGLKATAPEPGQAIRHAITVAQSLRLAATLDASPKEFMRHQQTLSQFPSRLVRWASAEAGISTAIGAPCSQNLVDKFIAYDLAFLDTLSRVGTAALALDDGPSLDLAAAPERWWPLWLAAAICSEGQLVSNAETWLVHIDERLGAESVAASLVHQLVEGATQPPGQLTAIAADWSRNPVIRSGAAVRLLQEPIEAQDAFGLQALLVSGLVGDPAWNTLQPLYTFHVGRRLAAFWIARVSAAPYQFRSPGRVLRELSIQTGQVVTTGHALKTLATALGHEPPPWMTRLL
jgi:hypothetical protein